MANYERKFGNQEYGRYGRSQYLQSWPQAGRQVYNDFSLGYVAVVPRENTPPNATPFAIDTRVTRHNEITRALGVATDEILSHIPEHMALHVNLDYAVELVLFAPPFIGVRRGGAVEWKDVGLPEYKRPFTSTNFGGTLVFSNGARRMYLREPNSTTIRTIEDAPPAQALVSFAGRILAGNTFIDGRTEPLGIVWSGASSNPRDWRGLGSGFELLIDDMSAGDRIVAMKSMGLDQLAILCRNSIWLGQRTGLRNRPVDFRPRVPSIGAVNSKTVQTTRNGVIFLSDSGVYIFDGNRVESVSQQINNDLLPLRREELGQFNSFYHPYEQIYYLFTPRETWIYEVENQRWFRRSLRARGAVLLHDQTDAILWAELEGNWVDQTGIWADWRPEIQETFRVMVLGEASGEPALGVEMEEEFCNFGKAMTPFWEFPMIVEDDVNKLYTFQNIQLKYRGYGIVGLRTPNAEGDYEGAAVYDLPLTNQPRTTTLPFLVTGQGAGIRLDLGQGIPRVSRVEMQVLARSARTKGHLLPRQNPEDYGRSL